MTLHAPTTHIEQVELVVGRALQAVLIIELAAAAITGNWWVVFVCSQAIVASFLPAILARNTRLNAPAGFQLVITIFIFATIFLGEVEGFYERFWWWDVALHTTSGLILGLVGFLMLFTLFEQNRVQMPPFLLSAFAVAFAMAMGSIWEVFEFVVDVSFGMRMQRDGLSDNSGLIDTMSDEIVNALGAIVMVSLAHWKTTQQRGRKWMVGFAEQFLDEPIVSRRGRGPSARRRPRVGRSPARVPQSG